MSIQDVFYPKSIAVIGASTKVKTVGNDVAKNLTSQDYQGDIYLVNPKADELYGKKVCHSIEEIGGDVDLAVFAIPAKFIPAEIEKLAGKNCKACIIISAGFKEIGNLELEQEVAKVCAQHNITLIGPNCLGSINPQISMNASFAVLMPKIGNVSFISQSGALVSALLDYAKDRDLGFAKFISIGNKAGAKELDLFKYFFQDEETQVIAAYSEDLINAPEFIQVIKENNLGPNPKPIVILKSGKTEEGSSAIASHTGSLSSGDATYEALFAQAGVIRADTVEQMFDLLEVFSKNKLQKVSNAAIITNAGGPGVLTTDAVVAADLELAKFTDETNDKLKAALRPAASYKNPVDVLGDAKAFEYQAALEALVSDSNTDSIIFLLTPQSMTELEETAQGIINIKDKIAKPLVVSFMGAQTVAPAIKLLRSANIATVSYPEAAAAALGAFAKFANWSAQDEDEAFSFDDIDKAKVASIFSDARAKGTTSFPEAAAMEIFRAYNFPLLKAEQANSEQEAVNLAKDFNCKLAMKIVSPDILHKSDVGGVMLNVTADDMAEKYQEMMKTVAHNKPDADLKGVYLMEMAPQGVELILGANRDPNLGMSIMFGLGGIYVEVLKDVTFGLTPISRGDAKRMIESINSYKILEGVRGQEAVDINAITDAMGRLSCLLTDFPEIVELDINPLLAFSGGTRVLDGRIVIK